VLRKEADGDTTCIRGVVVSDNNQVDNRCEVETILDTRSNQNLINKQVLKDNK
jgi:hypothetical protein